MTLKVNSLRRINLRRSLTVVAGMAAFIGLSAARVTAEAAEGPTGRAADQQGSVVIDSDDIGGTVNSSAGSEAGVWVIAETNDLPTVYRKVVVTDAAGRFVLPDLPKAKYRVWVRGYGLADSEPVSAAPGDELTLKAPLAADAKTAAQIYPANYWLSLIKVPPENHFAERGARRVEGISGGSPLLPDVARTQPEFLHEISLCSGCHQVGTKATRNLNPDLGKFPSVEAAWDHRLKVGAYGGHMDRVFAALPRDLGVAVFADWTKRIQEGATPPPPPRPQGVERDVVITEWEWGDGPSDWTHDAISTDKRDPRVNAHGLVFGGANGAGSLVILDPRTNTVSRKTVPLLVPEQRMTDALIDESKGNAKAEHVSSPLWGMRKPAEVWPGKTIPHNPIMDAQGRVWVTSRIRPVGENPVFCSDATNAYARVLPLKSSDRQVTMYDPKTDQWRLIDTCFGTHHLQFASDKDNTLYFSGGDGLVGWLNTRAYERTGDAAGAQGWCGIYSDFNASGHSQPGVHERLKTRAYGIAVSPIDGAVWYAAEGLPGHVVRFVRGSQPPATCRAEVYEPPFGKDVSEERLGFAPKGLDIGVDGVVWVTLHSGQLASFDRRKCPSSGATGQGCRVGWTLYRAPGPTEGNTSESADRLYYTWSDHFDTLGLGRNTQIATGSNSDSLLILPPGETMLRVFRVPYPLGFMPRGMDGRIDDPRTGWKGRGVWSTQGAIVVWHSENGFKSRPVLFHFQVRPNPLAH